VALSVNLTVLTRLETLLLGHNDFREEGALALAAALHHLPELIVLSLGRNDIGAAGAAALVPYFSGAKSCRRIPLGFMPDPHLSPTNP
jgi:Ran GTPase-activating protein (RanGAP) involved in mRNA processing and transport